MQILPLLRRRVVPHYSFNEGLFSDRVGLFPPEDGITSWTVPGLLAAVSAATAASAVGVFPAIAASVADGSAPPAVFARHSLSVYPGSRAPGPASAGACLVPAAAARFACPAAAGTSCPASGCRYLECSVPRAEVREDGMPGWVEPHYSRNAPDLLRDCLGYKGSPPLWRVLHHDL